MTPATREALVQVDRILHEAGWDQPEESDVVAPDLSEIEDQLESLSRTQYWQELCKLIGEFYQKAHFGLEEGSPPAATTSADKVSRDAGV